MALPQAAQNTNDITSVIQSLAQRGAGKEKKDIPGPKRAAMLMLALGEQYGGKVWELLDDDEVRETNSSSISSTTSASTVPSVDMWIDSSRTSSSSSSDQTLPPYCSPSASISIAARFGPLTASFCGRLP